MFFYASKILIWFVYPLSLGILLLILAYVALLVRGRKSFHFFFLPGLLILYLCSIEPVADSLLRPLERRYVGASRALKADAIVVLSGDVRRQAYPRVDVEVSGNRVLKAIRLYRQGAAPLIIMTGGSGDLFDPEFKEAVSMRKFAVEFGVPAEKIIVESRSRNTRENLLYTAGLLKQLKAKKVILVTSAFHLPRAHALLRKSGVETLPVASDYYAPDKTYDPFSFVPDVANLSRSTVAIKEYLALAVYWVMGWI